MKTQVFKGVHYLNSIQINSVYLYSAFYNTIVSRCFTKEETQSLNHQARKNSILTGRNLEQDPGLQGETFLLRVCRVKDKNERERQDRESKEREREKANTNTPDLT